MKTEHINSTIKFTLNQPFSLEKDTGRILEIPPSLEIKFRLLVANTGNTAAKVIGEFYLDTTSGDMIINKLLNNHSRNGAFIKIPESYYPDKQIDPEDTIKFWHNFKIQFIKNDTFTIHAMYLYENEIGQVFETYYRERFAYFPIPFNKMKPNEKIPIEINEFIKSVDRNQSTLMYTKEEGAQLYNRIDNLLDRK